MELTGIQSVPGGGPTSFLGCSSGVEEGRSVRSMVRVQECVWCRSQSR